MTPLSRVILLGVVSVYFALEGFLYFRNPSPGKPWITPYALMLFAALMLFSAFDAYRKRASPEPGPKFEPPTRTERLAFKAMGSFVILAGVALFTVVCWLAWGQWTRVARWPRANAILVRKEFSSVGARLAFEYDAEGLHCTGVAFRWGSESAMRAALESYEPGTIHKISYDPDDPTQVETVLNYGWDFFKGPTSGVVIGLALILGGVMVYRWSMAGHFKI